MGMLDKFEKLDRWVTTLTAIPVLGWVIKGVMDRVAKKGAEKIEKKVSEAVGLEVEETGKGFNDEILFREALRQLDAGRQQQVENFRLWLRKSHPKEADALVLGVAKAIKAFEKQTKRTQSSGGGKSGRPYEKAEYSSMEYDHSWSKSFFERLLARETDEAKREFVLVEENFRSLIPPEKRPSTALEYLRKASGLTEEATEDVLRKAAVSLRKFNDKYENKPSRWQAVISLRRR